MMWVTWRRYRFRIALLTLYVIALVVLLIVTEHAYESVAAGCRNFQTVARGRICTGPEGYVADVIPGIAFFPLLAGLVLGAPLVASELDAKTNRLAWAQGITRTRWLLTSWLTLAIATVAMMTVLILVVQWWVSHVYGTVFLGAIRLAPTGITGVAPIAIAIFALSFCVSIGALLRTASTSILGSLVGLAFLLSVITIQANKHHISQWAVAGIYMALTAAALSISVWEVRRWRA
jgi:ABC-type transport system involved in multi-copper enzyme maturation permease subunit